MRKSKTEQMRIPSSFETTTTKTERSAVAILMHWMRQIIDKGNLDLGLPDVDTSGADRKSPDNKLNTIGATRTIRTPQIRLGM